MHVLLATNNLHPDPGATGSGRYNHEVGRRLVERGHTVSVITRRRGDQPTRETVAGMDVRRYDASIPRLPLTLRAIGDHVASIRETAPIDLLSCHGALSSLGADRAVPDRVPRTYTIHGLWAVEYRNRVGDASAWAAPWHRLNRVARHRIEGRLLDRSDAAVVLSEFQRERLERHHHGTPPTSVIPGGVDVERFAPRDGGEGSDLVSPDGTAVLTVRRLTPRMGIGTLLDAFAEIVAGCGEGVETGDSDAAESLHLYVGGDGPLREALAARAERLGIDASVTFLGYVPEGQLPGLYAAADVFVLPTLELEGFGLATLEALASATPAIGTRAGATPAILGPLESDPDVPEPLLVPPGDAEALAAALRAWTALSPSALAAAGDACRAHVREAGYTWTQVTARLETLFERTIEERTDARS